MPPPARRGDSPRDGRFYHASPGHRGLRPLVPGLDSPVEGLSMTMLGSLHTMPLTDVLQWLGSSRRTGTLFLERNKVVKQIVFREGRVVACSSDDPPELLGHFLVHQGKIHEEVLHQALAKQSTSHEHLGKILLEMKALTSDDLRHLLEAKAEETIYSLFDWEEAEFRFDE